MKYLLTFVVAALAMAQQQKQVQKQPAPSAQPGGVTTQKTNINKGNGDDNGKQEGLDGQPINLWDGSIHLGGWNAWAENLERFKVPAGSLRVSISVPQSVSGGVVTMSSLTPVADLGTATSLSITVQGKTSTWQDVGVISLTLQANGSWALNRGAFSQQQRAANTALVKSNNHIELQHSSNPTLRLGKLTINGDVFDLATGCSVVVVHSVNKTPVNVPSPCQGRVGPSTAATAKQALRVAPRVNLQGINVSDALTPAGNKQ